MNAPIQLTGQQQEALFRLSRQTGRPWEEVFQEALATFERQVVPGNGAPAETVHSALVRLGLLGCVTDAPADLSTNPEHLEGFGSRGN
jgi:hypothetical protein